MIRVHELRKSFGAVDAVQKVTFSATDYCITGLLGPNGAGKSTTLRMLATLLRPDHGHAEIDGLDIIRHPIEARRRIGVLSHASGLYPHLTARENIEYFAALHGLSSARARQRADELASLLDMHEIMERRAKGFSQGQRLKTALARAMVHSPRNLILDEPTNGLDVMAVRALRELLTQLREAGHCILFSSHVMQEVAMLCDHVVVIAHGRVVADGSVETLRATSGEASLEDAFVKFIGSAEGIN